MRQGRLAHSLTALDRDAWNACFPGALEDYGYLPALRQSGLEGFRYRYLTVVDDGRLIAAAPAFLTDYAVDTGLDGWARRLAERLRRIAPRLLTLKLACIGSPGTETAPLGFAPDILPADHPALADLLLEVLELEAGHAHCGLVGFKDVAQADEPFWRAAWSRGGYRRIAGQPTTVLAIDFPSLEAYLARLSPGTRKDMRRKLKSLDRVQIEVRCDFHGVVEPVAALYRATRARAADAFETLTPAYFERTPALMGERVVCVLYRSGGELLAANLLLSDGRVLLDKFFCMGEQGRALNLYYLSWFTNLRLCLERGIELYLPGQAGYSEKRRLGGAMTPAWMAFRHRNPLLNAALGLLAPMMAFDGPGVSA